MYRKNGSGFAVGGERRPAGLRNRTPANCRWIGYAARDHRQHHGTLRDYWGTRRGNAEGCAWTLNLEPKPKSPPVKTAGLQKHFRARVFLATRNKPAISSLASKTDKTSTQNTRQFL